MAIKQEGGVDDDDDDRSPIAYVQALIKIVMSVSKDKLLIGKLENIIMPMIEHSLTFTGYEITDDCIECAILFVIHGSDRISHNMQMLFPKLIIFVLND